jgi:class 3 adenylate cyclase
LADTRRLIRSAVRRAGGHEVDARADESFAVFKHPPAAVEAAIAIQRAVRDHDWPAQNAVRLRAGVHSGRPTLTEGGYVGLAVHTTARVSAAAHGGQILLSGAATRAVGEAVAEGLRFVELGTFRLRGLPDDETLFQLTVADLPASFPPPVTDSL